jgi:hypothetical protein
MEKVDMKLFCKPFSAHIAGVTRSNSMAQELWPALTVGESAMLANGHARKKVQSDLQSCMQVDLPQLEIPLFKR